MFDFLIDSWKNDNRIQNYIKKRIAANTLYKYKYVNILEYCKRTYDINVTDLGKLFNVERQTIYNYYRLDSFKLSSLVLNTLCLAYSFKSIDLVIEKELLLFLDDNKGTDKKISEFRDSIKDSFKTIIKNSEDVYNYYLNNPITPVITSLLKKNDIRYVGQTLEILDKTNINTIHFLAYLMDYENFASERKDAKYNAYERIDYIISSKPGLISVDFMDFQPINKICLLYSNEVNENDEIEFNIPENILSDIIIVNITTSSNLTLLITEKILSSVRKNFSKNTHILLGILTDHNTSNIVVDVFAHEK